MNNWPTVKLGEVLTERREIPDSNDLDSGRVKIVEKISFGTGQTQLRNNGSTKTGMILVRPGDLLVSGINAAKGAIAIYDESASEPAAATIHYGAYIPKRENVDIHFLWWMLRSRFFQGLLFEYVPGGIKTELKAKRLLPIPVPLPPIAEQKHIVMRIEKLAIQIQEARNLRQEVAEETAGLVRSSLHHWMKKIAVNGILSDVLESPPRNGWSANCDNADIGMPILSLSAVTGFQYRSSEFKRTSMHAAPDGHFWLKSGDLLITRSNTPELVGHAAIYNGTPSPCIYPDLMMRLNTRGDIVFKRFVWYWLQSPLARDFIERKAKGTSPTMKKISQSIVMNIPFPTSIPIEKQKQIVAELDVLHAEVYKIKHLQIDSAAELDALLPAILDRAFKGELL
jgi:type I restriction enzyme S subunit